VQTGRRNQEEIRVGFRKREERNERNVYTENGAEHTVRGEDEEEKKLFMSSAGA